MQSKTRTHTSESGGKKTNPSTKPSGKKKLKTYMQSLLAQVRRKKKTAESRQVCCVPHRISMGRRKNKSRVWTFDTR